MLDERYKELSKQRDALQRERSRAQESLAVATAEKRVHEEQLHSERQRAAALEQQLQVAMRRLVELSGADAQVSGIESMFTQVNDRWGR